MTLFRWLLGWSFKIASWTTTKTPVPVSPSKILETTLQRLEIFKWIPTILVITFGLQNRRPGQGQGSFWNLKVMTRRDSRSQLQISNLCSLIFNLNQGEGYWHVCFCCCSKCCYWSGGALHQPRSISQSVMEKSSADQAIFSQTSWLVSLICNIQVVFKKLHIVW